MFEAKAQRKLRYNKKKMNLYHSLLPNENQKKKKTSFEDIGRELGCNEVYAASIFYGQVKKITRYTFYHDF